jgi:protein-L-isoaspartate(D-aspartate) O-methyltransferase
LTRAAAGAYIRGMRWWGVLIVTLACAQKPAPSAAAPPAGEAADAPPPSAPVRADAAHAAARERMVREQIEARGIKDARVLAALRKVPRHELVPPAQVRFAYADRPLPIGHAQTISQPYIVAAMTELAAVRKGDRVLEIGTGSGYQAAVLAELGAEVYSIEIVEPLARSAARALARLGYDRVRVRAGDGYKGWPEAAPFDAVVVTAAPPEVPQPLKEQLKPGGRLVIPVGKRSQELRVITRTADGFQERRVFPVRFVPMTGEAQR